MTDERLSPLPGDIRAMIDADRRGSGMPDDARQRVLKRMGAGFLAAGVATAAMGSGTAAAATSTLGGFFARKSALVLAAFLFGTAAGAGGYAVATRTTAKPTAPTTVATTVAAATTTVSQPAITQPPPVATTAPEVVASAPAVAAAHPAVAPSTTESAPKSRDEELAAERLLVEMGRSSLAHGQASQALDAVQKHATKYPNGQLVEERESIAIHALVAAGRAADARTRATNFHKRFPKSLFLPAIDAAVGPEP